MAAAEWFYEVQGKELGPVTAGQLKQLAVAGKLQPASMVWKQGALIRVPAQTVKGLFDPAAPKKPPEPEAAAVQGKPFRVMLGDKVRGPLSLAELRGLLEAGKIPAESLIGVETWVPLATLGELLGGETKTAKVEVKKVVEKAAGNTSVSGAPSSSDDGASLKVDDEFQL